LCAGPREAGGCEAIGPVGVGAAGVAVLVRSAALAQVPLGPHRGSWQSTAGTETPPLFVQLAPWPTGVWPCAQVPVRQAGVRQSVPLASVPQGSPFWSGSAALAQVPLGPHRGSWQSTAGTETPPLFVQLAPWPTGV